MMDQYGNGWCMRSSKKAKNGGIAKAKPAQFILLIAIGRIVKNPQIPVSISQRITRKYRSNLQALFQRALCFFRRSSGVEKNIGYIILVYHRSKIHGR